ncbi:extracellular solute-binding protein [Paenibacillus sp. CGMCC 1.16610]|uniref:Extracellular solute-binding protein n=1 Tax=Paenibacillus anseongense TaxID=2682845 RepID=A0ABW9U5Y8_9BACL|nr:MULTISPECIES: extracellular solute-binding protein [Paenibacillus]MBA2938692.1 extracellular solute-binding protein [Paenibacillus sp. CGMCC 1.16610]MVQ34655.1 extracellular solute-binding protein [Paenibacillus anseongense]
MKAKKGIMTVTGSLLLLSSVLSGCGSSSTTSPASTNNASTSAPATTAGAASTPAAAQPLSLTWMRYEHPSQAIVANSKAVQEIAKRKNVKLNLQSVPQSNYDDKKKTLIATNTLPDIMLVKQDDIQNFADSGTFLDLTPYLDKMPNLKKVISQQPEINKNKIDGKLYGFPLVANWQGVGGQLSMIRMDVLDKLGLKKPTTYDELYQVMKKMKEANPDSYPFTARAANGLTGTENLINPISFAFGSGYTTFNGTKVYYEPKDKTYKFGPAMPEFKEAITWLNKLYKEKLLDPDYATATSQIWQEKLNSGKSFYFQDNNGFASTFNINLQKKDPNAKFDMLDTMTTPSGAKRNLIYALGHLSESYVINAKVKNPEQVVQFMDWFYSQEGIEVTNFGVKGEDFTGENGDYKLTDAVVNKYKDRQPSAFYALQSEYGTGYLGLGLNNDDHAGLPFNTKEWVDWNNKASKGLAAGENVQFVNDPPFTKDEREKLKQIRTQLDAYLAQNMDKFIVTDGALKDWDNFVKQLKSKGADDIVKIYNDALARVK